MKDKHTQYGRITMKNIVVILTIVCITIAQCFTNQVLADELPQLFAYKSPIAIVWKAQGMGQIKRLNPRVTIPVSIGEKLYRGDLLRIAKGSKVVIKCDYNNKIWTIPEAIWVGVNNGCDGSLKLPQVEVL
ncbi:hypothetical protein BJP34_03695 [Moorena producens PAL-8-15-08-1]|uniref:Uncharacterized protein n=1 Tax=Moorena producens PAL-8-15-08-1 TaxID=1458985 RepID=A0A1D8TMN4_9CYAN|nr:hypothetical protein [Moorena producens]AOW98665.1 hypothetical protein BJP34_03695 [Moorena producens PAL-8-15-08-1]